MLLDAGITFEIIVHTKREKPDLNVWCEEIHNDFSLLAPFRRTPLKAIRYGDALNIQLSIDRIE